MAESLGDAFKKVKQAVERAADDAATEGEGSNINFAGRVNETTENIGARRLHTIMEKVLDEISFAGPDLEPKQQTIDSAYVSRTLTDIVKDQDLSRYIL